VALITGSNHDSVGLGVLTEQFAGHPGYDFIIVRRTPHSVTITALSTSIYDPQQRHKTYKKSGYRAEYK
jgi:hypothetical protein